MDIEGEEDPRVLDALQVLSKVYGEVITNKDSILKDKIKIGQNVAIIGGGNTAIDAARTAIRLGAKVTLFYRRSETEMPAYPEEVMEAKKEGIEFCYLSAPVAIHPDDRLKVEFIKMKLGLKDKSGRCSPIPIKNSNFSQDFDNVIIAIGQTIDLIDGINMNSKGWLVYNDTTYNVCEGVYIGGDVVGPYSVVESVAMGRKAAVQLHTFL